jgi:putative radical SAM enzyme (TIGR03279 family)
MPLRIKAIEPGSLAQEFGLIAGDKIISVNNIKIRDFLDLEFYCSDFRLDFVLEDPSAKLRELSIFRETAKPLGIIPEDYRHRNCKNHCIFCFIDQMPPGMRPSLYGKDDDYLYSFVFGNYITLTNLSEADLNRICAQHISPLYVSLHSSNLNMRQQLMRSVNPVDPIKVIRQLSEQGIEFHIQIVSVPGYNDGVELRQTITDLMDESLNILSIGIVPVGLTRYRDHLCQLQAYDEPGARKTLDLLDELRSTYHSQIIYPADEFYVLAQREVPEAEFYQDYPQLENGIGMLSLGEQTFARRKRALLKELRQGGGDYIILCSQSAQQHIRRVVKALNLRLKTQRVQMQVIHNDFFGEHISVAGLLTMADISSQFAPDGPCTVILPDVIFNHEGYTLDGKSRAEVRQQLGYPLLLVDQLWDHWQVLS